MKQAPVIEFQPGPALTVAEVTPQRNLGDRLRQFGRFAAATVGVTVALSAAEATVSPDNAMAAPAPIAQAVHSNILSPVDTTEPASVTAPITYEVPAVGVATGSWNDDGLGYHTLFKDMAAEGMSTVRLNYIGIKEVRAEVTSARANGIEPMLSMPLNLTPQEAAQVTAQLPGITKFVIGNEVNSPLFSDLTPEEYVAYLAHTTAAIHAARPDAQTLGFALASGFAPARYLMEADQFAIQEYGGLPRIMDGFAAHFYRTLDKIIWTLQIYKQIYDGPTYIDEFGSPVADSNHPDARSLADQAMNEIVTLNALAQYAQIKSVLIYKYRTNPNDPFDTANVAADGSFRPAYYALQSFLADQ